MRRLGIATLTLLAWAAPPAAAQDAAARAVIEKAVQSQGGLDNITKANAAYRKVKGAFHVDPFRFTGESYSNGGNRLRITLRGDAGDARVITLILNAGKGWNIYNGEVVPFDAKTTQRMARSTYVDKVSGLVSLLRDKGYTLTLLSDAPVEGKAAARVRVQSAGMPDVQLYFHKTDGYLLMTAYATIDPGTDKEVNQEVHYRTPEPFDPAAEPLAALEKAKRETSDAALFQFLAERIPSNKEREKIDLLLPELGQVSFAARERATAALRQFGVKAAAHLRQAADSDDSEVVRRATQLLDKIAQDPAMACTTAVVRLLAVRRPEGTAAALLAYYPWACDEATGKEVLYALAAVVEADAAAKKVVEAALDDADPRVRTAASCVLGTDGGAFLKQPGRRVLVEGVRFSRAVEIRRGGQLYMEMVTTDHAFYNRFEDKLFAPP